MKLNTIKTLISSVILGGLMVSCGPDKVGPELKGASDSFNKAVDFHFYQDDVKDADVEFHLYDESFFESNKFNEEVTWTLTVSGYRSGATAKFSATSDQVKETNCKWVYGQSENVFFFQRTEYLKFELDIIGLDTTYVTDSVEVIGVCKWNRKEINNVKHFVVDAFESDLPNPTSGMSATSPDNNDKDVMVSVTDVNNVEGAKSLFLTGTDLNNNGWVGGRNHERLVELHSANSIENMSIDSGVSEDELFFNIFIYGDSRKPGTTVEIKAFENEDTTFKSRDDLRLYALDEASTLTANQQAKSDGWIYDIIVNWDGWKMISVPYSQFRAANDPKTGAGGDRVKESGKISAIAVNLLSYPTSGLDVSTYIDFMSITQGGRPQFKLK